MKKTISIFLLMCFSLSLMGMASAETGSNEATIKGQILAYTEDWFTDNFSEHYDISDYEASVNNFQQSGAEIYAEIAACAVTTLKYNSVEELPYMEGIKDSLQINSLAEVIPVEYVTQQSAIAASELQKSVEFATSQSTTRLSLDANTQRSILTPQMVAENIEWISIQTKQGNQRKELHPGEKPEACFALCKGDEVEAAYAYCNLHSLWKK